MSPPLLGIKGGGQNNDALVPSPATPESVLKEHNYFGLSDCSSVDSSNVSSLSEESKKVNLNFKATELRLGLPGSQSPERDPEVCLVSSAKLDEKQLFPLTPVSGNKRGFSDTMEKVPSEGNWMFKSSGSRDSDAPSSVVQGKISTNSGVQAMLNPSAPQAPQKTIQEQPRSSTTAVPAAK